MEDLNYKILSRMLEDYREHESLEEEADTSGNFSSIRSASEMLARTTQYERELERKHNLMKNSNKLSSFF